MRNVQDNYRDDRNREPRRLHELRHGNRSDRGNYTQDTNFNAGYDQGSQDPASFNTGEDHSFSSRQGRFQVGGATYSGDDFARGRPNRGDNLYGMSYTDDDGYNSDRHYDPRADYSDSDYEDLRRQGRSRERYGMADERFGHDVSRGRKNRENEYLGRSSRGDYESYRRYEYGNPNYDNDYSTGFSGRNYTAGRPHYGEDSHYSNLERWQGHSNPRQDRYDQERRRRY